MNVPTVIDMLKAGAHFGHKKSKRHPKMQEYIFTTKNDICILDLTKTIEYLEKALRFVTDTIAGGGLILFVGTKKQTASAIKTAALSCGMPYVDTRWIGGTITNYAIINKMIKKYKKLKEKQETGEFAKYTKKEQLELSREIDELEGLIGGIQTLAKLPDAVFIVDVKKEKTALKEALKKKIPVIALCDTNVNPTGIDYVIPANDDASRSTSLFITCITDAIKEAKEKALINTEKPPMSEMAIVQEDAQSTEREETL